MDDTSVRMLPSDCRVLDFTDGHGLLCGRILADFGADVLQVEPPGGSRARYIPPFWHDDPSAEMGLYWLAYAANKRSITLSLATAEGQEILRRLVADATLVVESFPTGQGDRLGLDYHSLKEVNPGIILVSVTPFGKTGPHAEYKGPDLVVTATGGIAYLTGDPSLPPVRVSFPQAHVVAGASAALGALLAYFHREATGRGQWVDVSAQQAIARTIVQAPQTWDLNKVNLRRQGLNRERPGGVVFPTTWRCRDGFVNFSIAGGRFGAKRMEAVLAWMEEAGEAHPALKGIDWESMDFSQLTQDLVDRALGPVARFFASRSKRELWQGALQRQMTMFPVATSKDIVEDVSLVSPHFVQGVPDPYRGATVRYPGPFVRSSGALMNIRRPAPTIGEHNEEVYCGDLGLSRRALAALRSWKVI